MDSKLTLEIEKDEIGSVISSQKFGELLENGYVMIFRTKNVNILLNIVNTIKNYSDIVSGSLDINSETKKEKFKIILDKEGKEIYYELYIMKEDRQKMEKIVSETQLKVSLINFKKSPLK